MNHILPITRPDQPQLEALTAWLREHGNKTDRIEDWPREQLRKCGEAGVYAWFLDESHGGRGWSVEDICRGYLALSAGCLTTTFIITQFMGACQRIARSENREVQQRWLDDLMAGRRLATVGISHLTTSRRHLASPVLRATPTANGFVLDGYSPWVTGACHADLVVTGATLDDGRQILCAVPTDLEGVHAPRPRELVALSASCTGPMEFRQVAVPEDWLLAGPVADVMQTGTGANTGGIQTSTLALGLASAAIEFLEKEATQRGLLQEPADVLRAQWRRLVDQLLAVAAGKDACSTEQLRAESNRMALRAAQSALVAAKGAGFVVGHPAGRWCREALFFLVWSCPQNVLSAHLCELAGLSD